MKTIVGVLVLCVGAWAQFPSGGNTFPPSSGGASSGWTYDASGHTITAASGSSVLVGTTVLVPLVCDGVTDNQPKMQVAVNAYPSVTFTGAGSSACMVGSATTLASNSSAYIRDITIQRLNTMRDNIFRSANVGYGITSFTPETNVNIIGEGNAILAGAANPRSSGDAGKTLSLTPSGGSQSYGTDAGVGGQTQTGDWRDYTILFGYVNGFQIKNLTLKNQQSWGMSFERSTGGLISGIVNSATGSIGGHQVLNQDSVDLRLGSNSTTIENISGTTGDDTVAISAFNSTTETPEAPGVYGTSQVTGDTSRGASDDIHDIQVRGVVATSLTRPVRIIGAGQNVYNIIVDGVSDLSTGTGSTVAIGASVAGTYGQVHDVQLSHISSPAINAIEVIDSLVNSTVSDIDSSGSVAFMSDFGNQGINNIVLSNLTPLPGPLARNANLVAFWPINEGTGSSVFDYSGNTATATYAGTPNIGALGYYGFSSLGTVGDFNGTDNKISITDNTLKHNAITVTAWINPATTSGSPALLSIASGATNWSGVGIELFGNGPKCWYGDGAGTGSAHWRIVQQLTNIYAGSWYHVACVISGNSITVYVNGNSGPNAAAGTGGSLVFGSQPTMIGDDGLGDVLYSGLARNVRVYNVALTAADINQLYRTQQ